MLKIYNELDATQTSTYISYKIKTDFIKKALFNNNFYQRTKKSSVFYTNKWNGIIKVCPSYFYVKAYTIPYCIIKNIVYDEINNLLLINDDLAIKMI